MTGSRVERLNSLLKEVIAEVIHRDVKNPLVNEFVTVSRVEISKDLRHAKVYISVLGDEIEKTSTLKALESAAGFISVQSSRKVTMRFFPTLKFIIDDTVDKHMRIEELLQEIHNEELQRGAHDERDERTSDS